MLGAAFVVRVCIRVQKTNGDGTDPFFPTRLDNRVKILQLNGFDDVAIVVDSLTHFETQMARHKGRRFDVPEIIHARSVSPTDLGHVTKASCGNECGLYTLALGDGVDDYRTAVHEVGRVFERELGAVDRVGHASREVGRSA